MGNGLYSEKRLGDAVVGVADSARMKKTRRRTIILICVGTVFLVGGGFGLKSCLSSPDETEGTATRRVERATVEATLTASGTIRSSKASGLNFGAPGKVTAVKVEVGEKVGAGTELARIDSVGARSQLEAKKLAVASARAQRQQASTGKYGSPAERQAAIGKANADVQQAEADLKTAREQLGNTVLKAPFAGTVLSVGGQVGDTVSGGGSTQPERDTGSKPAQDPMMMGGDGGSAPASPELPTGFVVLADLSSLEVSANFAEIDAARLKAGQKATVVLSAAQDQKLTATVTRIGYTPNSNGKVVQFPATLRLDSPPAGIRPGQTASVSILVGRRANVLTVTSAALSGTGSSATVLVKRGEKTETVPVKLGLRGENGVEVLSGLKEGDEVVVRAEESHSGGPGW